jgi:hypothetical protein
VLEELVEHVLRFVLGGYELEHVMGSFVGEIGGPQRTIRNLRFALIYLDVAISQCLHGLEHS